MIKNESDTVTFICQFSGIPGPEVKWQRDNTELSFTLVSYTQSTSEELGLEVINSTLEITGVKKSDEGMYTCTGVNSVENLIAAVDSDSASLAVQGLFPFILSQI